MKENKIFEVNSLDSIEDINVLGKCPICGKTRTEENEDEFTYVYFSETDSYEYVCEECKNSGCYSFCDACQSDFPCVRPDEEFVQVWEGSEFSSFGRIESEVRVIDRVCKDIIKYTDCYKKCEKCGSYCLASLLEESGLCPDCAEEAEAD